MVPFCNIDLLDQIETSAFSLMLDGQDYLVIREKHRLYVYLNKCPHRNKALNVASINNILDEGNNFIICQHHQAIFTIEDGLCIKGPCNGASLLKVPLTNELLSKINNVL